MSPVLTQLPRWVHLAPFVIVLGGAASTRTGAIRPLPETRAACPEATPAPAAATQARGGSCLADDDACLRERCSEGDGKACFNGQLHAQGCEVGHAPSCAMVAIQSSGLAQRLMFEKACRLGDGPSCEQAAFLRAVKGDLTGDSCYEAFVRQACALGVASSCTLAHHCDFVAPAQTPSPAPASLAVYLRSPTDSAARGLVDPSLEKTSVALRLLAGPSSASATELEGLVDALLGAPDEEESWSSRSGCVISPGRASDRDQVAPVLFQSAGSLPLQNLVIRLRSGLDGAQAWVARCRCYPDEVFLLDAETKKVLASQALTRPVPRSGLIRESQAEPRRSISLDGHPAGLALRWRGRLRQLPLRLEHVRFSDLFGATLSAAGYEPFTITANALKQPVFGESGPEQFGDATWYVVLRPSRPTGVGVR